MKARETKNNNNMILGRQLNFCICHCLKILLHFYVVCFFSVQHFAAKKQGVQASLKSNINNIQWQSCHCWVTVTSQCLKCLFDIPLAHAVYRWTPLLGNKNAALMSSGQLKWVSKDILKKKKCLHYSDKNKRNNIITVIHFGLGPVHYNN